MIKIKTPTLNYWTRTRTKKSAKSLLASRAAKKNRWTDEPWDKRRRWNARLQAIGGVMLILLYIIIAIASR